MIVNELLATRTLLVQVEPETDVLADAAESVTVQSILDTVPGLATCPLTAMLAVAGVLIDPPSAIGVVVPTLVPTVGVTVVKEMAELAALA